MPVVRTYACDECGHAFDHFHLRRDEPAPECPGCAGAVEVRPGRFSIGTNRGKAIDIAQSVAENEYGFTNMQDNTREGDIVAPKVSPIQAAEAEQLTRAMKEAHEQAQGHLAPDAPPEMNLGTFWQQASGAPLVDPTAGAAGASEARAMGVDAVSLVEKAKQSGQDRMKFQVLARGNGG